MLDGKDRGMGRGVSCYKKNLKKIVQIEFFRPFEYFPEYSRPILCLSTTARSTFLATPLPQTATSLGRQLVWDCKLPFHITESAWSCCSICWARKQLIHYSRVQIGFKSVGNASTIDQARTRHSNHDSRIKFVTHLWNEVFTAESSRGPARGRQTK